MAFVVIGVNMCLALQHSAHFQITIIVFALSVLAFFVTMQLAPMFAVSDGLRGSLRYLIGFSCFRFWFALLFFIAALGLSTAFFLRCPCFQDVTDDLSPAEHVLNMITRFIHGGEKLEKQDEGVRLEMPMGPESSLELTRVSSTPRPSLQEIPRQAPPEKKRVSIKSDDAPQSEEIPTVARRASMTSFSMECSKSFRSIPEVPSSKADAQQCSFGVAKSEPTSTYVERRSIRNSLSNPNLMAVVSEPSSFHSSKSN
jgi:hypothetical protein